MLTHASQLHTSQLPRFFPSSVAVELFEAGRALRLLRRAKPSHPLCRPQAIKGTGRGLVWSGDEVEKYVSSPSLYYSSDTTSRAAMDPAYSRGLERFADKSRNGDSLPVPPDRPHSMIRLRLHHHHHLNPSFLAPRSTPRSSPLSSVSLTNLPRRPQARSPRGRARGSTASYSTSSLPGSQQRTT